MTRNTGDFQGGANKFYAAATERGVWHAHVDVPGAYPGSNKALCGATVWGEPDKPTARIDGDAYTPPSQWVECSKCEKAIRKSRGI